MILKGRKKILTQYTTSDILSDASKLVDMLNVAMGIHSQNKLEIDYLTEYRNGVQPILQKVKPIRPEINNTSVYNHAQMITRNIVGYFLGTPIQYIQNGDTTKKEQIDLLNRYVAYEDKASVDKEIGEYQSIGGTAFRIIYTDGMLADEVPFEDRALNPAYTFVIYENSIAEKPVAGVTYYDIFGEDGSIIGRKMYVFTDEGKYVIDTNPNDLISEKDEMNFEPYSVGGVPIIEYPNNMWRIGDWELALGLMDAINALQNGRLDDIDQIVQSLLVFINAEVDKEKYDEMREAGVVMITNKTGLPTDIKTVGTSLDHAGLNLFAQELESLLYAMIGIPDRNNRAGGGGDTGVAVELRDGWADLEVVARNKELTFKKSEKQTLRIILNILNASDRTELSLLDVDIKFSRNKNNNLQVKTQSYQTLLSTKTLSPADCLTIVDLVSDVNEYIDRGKAFWGSAFAGLEQANVAVESSKAMLENTKNPPETTKPEGKPASKSVVKKE